MRKFKPLLYLVLFVFVFSININLLVMPAAAESATGKEMTVLFTNDLHDHLLPALDEKDGKIYSSGGYARLKSAISDAKKQAPDALLLDAGDFSMGTPFQTIFTTEAPELRIMGKLGFDVTTFGNHEYDYRASGLAESLKAALKSGGRLPGIVQSNVTFPVDKEGNLTDSLKELKSAYEEYGVKDYTIIERNGLKIGIFGVMGKDSASNAPKSEVRFTDAVENAKRVVKILKEKEKTDLIICLSHSGIWDKKSESEDEILAQKVPEINVIISGHTHTEMDEPIIAGKTIIGSTGDSCRYLGVIKLVQGQNEAWELEDYSLKRIDGTLREDTEIQQIINNYKASVEDEYFSRFDLNFDQVLVASPYNFNTVIKMTKKHQEDPLGNLISDAYIYAVSSAEGKNYVPVTAAIVPVGTIRSTFFKGNITVADVFSTSSLGIGPDNVPGYPLISLYLTGKELKTACEVDASVSPMMEDAQLYISGLSFTFNPSRLIFNKVTKVSLQKIDGSNEKLDDNKLYRVVAGLYSAQMLSVVGDKSFGLLSIVPKDKDGLPIKDFEANIVKENINGKSTEVKEWKAVASYLQSFDKADGVPQIPAYYGTTHNRKVVDDNQNLFAVLNNPNGIAIAAYAIMLFLAVLFIFIIYRLTTRKTRKSLM